MVKIEIVMTPYSFLGSVINLLQVLLQKDYILTICRLSTDYIQVLRNRKINYFATKIHLFLVEKNGCYLYRIDYRSKNGRR